MSLKAIRRKLGGRRITAAVLKRLHVHVAKKPKKRKRRRRRK